MRAYDGEQHAARGLAVALGILASVVYPGAVGEAFRDSPVSLAVVRTEEIEQKASTRSNGPPLRAYENDSKTLPRELICKA